MKIIISTQTFLPKIGGMQILMSSIASGLSKLEFDVSVFPDHYCKKNLYYKVYNTIFPKILRPLAKRINIFFKSDKNDIYICDSWKSVHSIPKNAKNIICFSLAQELLVRKQKEIRIQKAFDRCKYIIPISNFTSSKIKSKWIVEEKKIKVINPTFSIKTKNIINKKISNNPLVIFSLCRIEKRKGLLQVANSLIRVKKSLPNFRWHIAGNGDAKEALVDIIKNSKIRNNVIFEDMVTEKNKDLIFKMADLFVMPSYQEGKSLEGYGIAYSEASSYGVPSIGGIDGGAPDAIVNGSTGWCINPNNKNEIDNAIKEALKNKTKRLQFGKNALNLFESKQTSEIAFKKLIHLF